MRKAKVTVPAVSTNLGPGVESLGLALGLHLNTTLIERGDTRIVIDTHGEGAGVLPPDCYHPVMYAAIRVFQKLEDSPLGLRIDVQNKIPLKSGLGAEAALTVAGLVGANNLMGSRLKQNELIAMGAELLGRPDGVIASMLGGLTISASGNGDFLYRRIDVESLRVVVVLPQVEDYDPATIGRPEEVALSDAVYNLGRQALVADALRTNDFDLLGKALDDRLLRPRISEHIPGFTQAIEAARESGAVAVTLSGEGPALLIFALYNHYRIAAAVQAVFDEHHVMSRAWTLPVDTQGVVITAAETLPG